MIVIPIIQSEFHENSGRRRFRWVDRASLAGWWRRLPGWKRRPSRRLFLDDDPMRAELFLKENGGAIWVTTAADCLNRLVERWDEVHLDHDLDGETYVDHANANCGMEVIRWLCAEPRKHLRRTSFFVHTHNVAAGLLMILRMRENGYRAEFRPFGHDLAKALAQNDTLEPTGLPTLLREAMINKWRAVRWRSLRKSIKGRR